MQGMQLIWESVGGDMFAVIHNAHARTGESTLLCWKFSSPPLTDVDPLGAGHGCDMGVSGIMFTVSSWRACAQLSSTLYCWKLSCPSLIGGICFFAQGFDLIWRSVGGDSLTTCTRAPTQHMVLLKVFIAIPH